MFNRVFNFENNRSLKNGMPNMYNTLTGWEVPLSLVKVTQSIVKGDLVQKEEKIDFIGVFQPLTDEQLQYKDVGERSWSWYWIHAKAGSLNLQTQDRIIFNNKRYKVMNIKDYSLNGYISYEIILDYKKGIE